MNFVTYYPSATESGCGHFCTWGAASTLSGDIDRASLLKRYAGSPVVDIGNVPWGAISEAPDDCGPDYFVRWGGVIIGGAP